MYIQGSKSISGFFRTSTKKSREMICLHVTDWNVMNSRKNLS